MDFWVEEVMGRLNIFLEDFLYSSVQKAWFENYNIKKKIFNFIRIFNMMMS
jgi:hypothetical protein